MMTVWRRMAAIAALAVLAGIAAAVIVWMFDAGLARELAGLFLDPIVAAVSVLALVGATVSLAGGLKRHRTEGYSVLWCRRFGDHEATAGQRNIWTSAVLAKAAEGFALPVTLVDRSVDGAQSVSSGLQVPITLLVMFVATAGFLAVGLSLPDWLANSALGSFGIFALYIATMVGVGAGVGWLVSSFSTSREDPDGLRRLLATARQKKSFWGEKVVVRCTDDDWQACVGALIDECDFIILDVTETNLNVGWEIARSLEAKGGERVLFVREVDDGTAAALHRVPLSQVDSANAGGAPDGQPVALLTWGAGWVQLERDAYLRHAREDDAIGVLAERSSHLAELFRQWMHETERSSYAGGAL